MIGESLLTTKALQEFIAIYVHFDNEYIYTNNHI